MKLLLFTRHQRDAMASAISAITRGSMEHAAILISDGKPGTPHTIVENFWPHVRQRVLDPSEYAGALVFSVVGLTPEKEARALDYIRRCLAYPVHYSIAGLFRFFPFCRVFMGEGELGDASMLAPSFCSQWAFKVFRDGAGIELLRRHSQDVDPETLSGSEFLNLEAQLS